MQSIELVRDNLNRSTDRVLARVEEMREHCMIPPTARGGAHTLWVLGHLAYIEGLIVQGFLLGEPNPLAAWEEIFDGDEVSAEAEDYPPFDRVLAECRRMRERTLELLEGLGEEDLDRVATAVPRGWEDSFGSYRLCLQYLADHWYMHRGQLADARRAAGLERMWV